MAKKTQLKNCSANGGQPDIKTICYWLHPCCGDFTCMKLLQKSPDCMREGYGSCRHYFPNRNDFPITECVGRKRNH